MTTNPITVQNEILSAIEEDDSINLLAAGLIHRARAILTEVGISDETPGFVWALDTIIRQVMTGDIVGKHIEVDLEDASDFNFGPSVTVTLDMSEEN